MKKYLLLLFLIPTLVSAQVYNNYWKLLSGVLQPNISTWSFQVPQLGGSGTKCVQVDNNGLFSVTGCSGGGGGGSGSVSTSTHEVSGQIPFFTSNSATPALIGGSSSFTWDNTNYILGLSPSIDQVSQINTGGEFDIVVGGDGEQFNISTHDGTSANSTGGYLHLSTGVGSTTAQGGGITVVSGGGSLDSNGTGNGGNILLDTGSGGALSGNGGDLIFRVGNGTIPGKFKFQPKQASIGSAVLDFNSLSLADRTFSYPDISGTVAIGVSTTTSQLAYWGTDSALHSVATSTLTPTSPLTGSFTVIGSGSLGLQAANTSQNGYLSVGDYSLLHTATTTFSAPLVYTGSTNAVTCTNATGSVNGCLTSTDWTTFNNKSPFPFTNPTNFGTTTSATSTPIWAKNGIFASTTNGVASQFDNASTTLLTTGALWDTALTSVLSLFDANHKATAYAGSNPCVNQVALSISASGVISCTSVANAMLSNSTIGATSPNSTLSFGSAAALGSTFTGDLNLATANNWTGLQQFKISSSTTFSAGYAAFGETATSTFNRAGVLTLITPLAIGSGGTASSTGGVSNGVEFYNGSTLTNGYNFNWNGTNVGIGTTTPYALLSVGNTNGIGLTNTATSTFNAAFGLNLQGGGCYAISGTCINGPSGQNLSTGGLSPATGDGSTTAFTSTFTPFQVFVNGVYQTLTTDYSVSGSGPYTITFTTAPSNAAILSYIYNSGAGVAANTIANGATATTTGGVTNGVEYFNGTTLTNGYNFGFNGTNVSIGTSTFPYENLTIYGAGSTAAASPQMTFAASSTVASTKSALNTWSMGIDLSDAGKFKMSSSSVIGTNDRMVFDGNGNVYFGTTSPAANAAIKLQLGNNLGTANGTTTISMGKIQFDGYNAAGSRICVFINSANALGVKAGACNN